MSWQRNSFPLVVILEAEVTCPCELLNHHFPFEFTFTSNGMSIKCTHTSTACVCFCLFLCYSICVAPLGGTSVSISWWESRLSHYSTMWPCLIVSEHFSYHSSLLDKSKWKRSHKGVIQYYAKLLSHQLFLCSLLQTSQNLLSFLKWCSAGFQKVFQSFCFTLWLHFHSCYLHLAIVRRKVFVF